MKEQKRYETAIYCRLSKDDDTRIGESSSITSQKEMLEKYVIEKGWNIYDYYIDDGYSGTNFNRPDFNRLIQDVEACKINCIITKDLSRLGRNYLTTGQYTEIYFPSKGVRYIALNDGVDTLNNDNDITPFKNILNEFYSRDISKKVRSAIAARQQRGEYLSNYAPIGYKKNPEDKHKLIIEEIGASIVRRIFDIASTNVGSKKICKVLNDEGVLTPINHRNKLLFNIDPKPARWTAESVNAILRHRVYIGETVQGIYECVRFKRVPNKRKPQDEWIITPGTHEPLVRVETFELVQRMIDSRNRPLKSNMLQLFAGFVKCKECGYALGYSNSHGTENYSCGTYRRHGKKFCTCHYIRKDVLEALVLEDIRKYSKLAETNADKLAKDLNEQNDGNNASKIWTLKIELTKLDGRNAEIEDILKRLYEDNVIGKLSDDRFGKFLDEYEREQSEVQLKIVDTKKSVDANSAAQKDIGSWIKLIRNYASTESLDRAVLNDLVEKITVGEAKIVDGQKANDITIYYRFIGAIG